MKKLILTALISMGFVLCNANAWANPLIVPNNSGVPNQVYQDINYVFGTAGVTDPYGTLANNTQAANDFEYTGPDSYWEELAPAGSKASVAVISIGAANTDTLGVFSQGSSVPSSINYIAPTETGFTTLGNGSFSNPFPGNAGDQSGHFGFALQTISHWNGQPNYWYSDPGLNSDGTHMLAFYLPQLNGTTFYVNDGTSTKKITLGQNTYLMGWEDNPLSPSDNDYKDEVFLVTNVIPAPEPMTLVLFAFGVIALFGFAWRKRLVVA